MTAATDHEARTAYYQAALSCLRFLEHRSPTNRRFGPDPDARWAAFRGHLAVADRIDLLLRDADAQWPAAFGARTVFARRAVAEDEPFGADWSPLDPVDAEELWRDMLGKPAPVDVRQALEACAAAWGIRLSPVDLGAVGAAERLVVAGPSAIAATIAAFATGADLDWVDQVVCVATPHAHRQLAALGGALLNATKATALVTPAGAVPGGGARRLVLSDDADPADATFAREHSGR